MIEARELSKSYDGVEALRGVSFSVKQGEIIGLLGPNGAGKTTLMKILAGYLHPTSGMATVDGFDVVAEAAKVQERIGYLPENAPLYPELTVQSQLQMIAALRDIPEGDRLRRLSEAIRAVGLEDRLTKPIATLSKGYRQRVGLAQAMVHQPRLLILDEPTNGLDPTQIVEVRHLIRKLAKHSTVLLSTHILSEVEATCDRAIIIMAGELKADARLSELAASNDAILTLALNDESDSGPVVEQLQAVSGVSQVEAEPLPGGRISFRVHSRESGRDLCPELYELSKAKEWSLCELKNETHTLEAVFNRLTATGGAQ